ISDASMVVALLPSVGLALHLIVVRARALPIPAARPLEGREGQAERLSPDELPRLRLLLDRALQPIGRFNGFDHLDQFQTAALRYQVNFIAYALAAVQARYLPAYEGHLAEAQRRLLAKLGEPVVWSYWKAEAAWGQFRWNADPVARDNIMYSGFAALQMGLGGGNELKLNGKAGDEVARYTSGDLAQALSAQYETAPLGLVACEPGWIYPLCNAMTACGLAGLDARHGTDHWPSVRDTFARHLADDFTTSGQRFIPARSSLTGTAMPPLGGVVPEAMTCLFLNAVLPDVADKHWSVIAKRLRGGLRKRDFWPVDNGNYRLGRGAALAGTAAAAAEMGDLDLRDDLLAWLDREHPEVSDGASRHRPGVSLWSHAVEVMARHGDTGLLSTMVNSPQRARLRIETLNWPEVQPLAAHVEGTRLNATLWSDGPTFAELTIMGLFAKQACVISGTTHLADADGRLALRLPVHGETRFTLEALV
ncbi:MAG: hypothetical protein ABI459_06965, partial [Deltaproteobacteria bacterium]